MGRRLYRLVETRWYRYNYTDPTVAEESNPCRSLMKRRGQTAHASTMHGLTVGFIAESFPPHLPSLRAAEKGSDKQCAVSPKPADDTDHRSLRFIFPLIWASFPISYRPIAALIPPITYSFGRAPP
jgi:hypothetical protein